MAGSTRSCVFAPLPLNSSLTCTCAKRLQIEVIVDEILEIADDASNDSVINEEDGKITALPEFPWFAQLLGQGPTYVLYVGWALAQDHYKYHGNSGRAKITIDHEHINRSRLKIDTRKWLAAKLCPRMYGDKNERITLNFPRLSMSSEVFRALANEEITPDHARTVIEG